LASLVVCFFARGVYTPQVVREALAVAGFDLSDDDLARLGRETLMRKHAFKAREGFDLAQQHIPRRVLETPSPLGQLDEAFLRRVLHIVAAQGSGEP
jgi:aldehyde:ferredoxin oxidoreductase